ncbi:MAG: STAS domain-containing protein [Gammaproteobacteria bacterium]
MNGLSIINKGGGRIAVSGDMTFASIDKRTAKATAFLASAKEITIDMAGIASTDSAGLALMIEWLKYARSKRVQLRFQHVPEQLMTLAKLSGFDNTGYFKINSD